MEMNIHDSMHVKDKTHSEVHGFHGHVQIYRRNKNTKETSLWYEGENVVTLSGYQFILTKILNLFLDSSHGHSYDQKDKDTTLITPDLNEEEGAYSAGGMSIGVDPSLYTTMDENISSKHYIQGFMVGNGGAGEDTITSKNTNYAFKNLRNPIPFQETQSALPASLAGKYCGVLRTGTSTKAYYIKRFDETPHIYHGWWRDGQDWDEENKVGTDALGPNSSVGNHERRIETYAEMKLTIDEGDFVSYFNHSSDPNSTAMINELGLVAFDLSSGKRSGIIDLYNQQITYLLKMVFEQSVEDATKVQELAALVRDGIESIKESESHITAFYNVLDELVTATEYTSIKAELTSKDCIEAEAYYNQNGELKYVTDKFLEYLNDVAFTDEDEAQRIKLVTYYTFNSIPIDSNFELLINYRLYAN